MWLLFIHVLDFDSEVEIKREVIYFQISLMIFFLCKKGKE